jgi:hypothetical protein
MDRDSEFVSLLSNEVQMVPILTRLVGDEEQLPYERIVCAFVR